MKIPSKFTLGATKWAVKLVDHLDDTEQGRCDPKTATICILKNKNHQIMEQVYCHELIHAFTFSTGRVENHDEVAIDGQAHYLHQYLVETYKD